MWQSAFDIRWNVQKASRLAPLADRAGISAGNIAALLVCGTFSALMIGLAHLRIGIPGHAIVRVVLPMAMGFALVPRRSAGMIMSVGAGLAAAALSFGHIGFFPPGALLSLLVLGPVLDAALVGKPQGWRLYARFIIAGAGANVLAFAAKMAIARLGWEMANSRQFMSFWQLAFVSFVLCGAFAGLISAAIWFRLRVDDDVRRP